MITFLRGVVCENLPHRLTLDVNGVGYEVLVPLSGAEGFAATGDTVTVLTYLHVREQEQTLYGFRSEEERDLFRLLIDRVSGVGPKVALAILGGMAAGDFKRAVVENDITALARIKGLGKKTAERIVLELKDKVGVDKAWEGVASGRPQSPQEQRVGDAVMALIALGYKQADASKAVAAVIDAEEAEGANSREALLRAALKRLQ